MIAGRRVVALILSGGGGTRLWPVSTEAQPKQFLKLFGPRSLFQLTLQRLASLAFDDVVVVANAAQESLLREQIYESGVAAPTTVLEPLRRDSAAAIAVGVAAALAQHPRDTIFVVLPSDHLVPEDAEFGKTLGDAVGVAAGGHIVTFGIAPTGPSTEFGYIERGPALAGAAKAFKVEKFHEKPDRRTAERYVNDGRYSWNSGMFVFRGDTFAEEAARLMPQVWDAADAAVRTGGRSGTRLLLDRDAFARAPKISIDYALLEKSERVAVVPASFTWSDVGNWASVHAVLAKDPAGNATLGQVVTRDAGGNLIIGEGMKVAVVGVDNLVVVVSANGAFVAPLSRAAEIKALLEE